MVYAIAIDATSHALQDTSGYQALWHEMLTRRTRSAPEPSYDAFIGALGQAMPNLSGVSIRPLGWVMTYLLLYLGVGVVLNWIVWNYFKRREMAWVCLIGFSFAFTAYAMFFGRSGNLREAQQQTVAVATLNEDGTRAQVRATTGILTARTRTYSGTIEGARPVVRDAAARSTNINMFTGMPGPAIDSRPFGWVQSDPGRIESFRVGASELRLVTVEGERAIDGGIAGALELDASGLRGTLENKSGFGFTRASIVFDGAFIPMAISGNQLSVAASTSEISRLRENESVSPQQLQYLAYNWGSSHDTVWQAVQAALFVADGFQFNFDLPPYLIAWSDDSPGVGLVPDQTMTKSTVQTVVVSRLPVEDRRGQSDLPVPVNFGGDWFRSREAPPTQFGQAATAGVHGPIRVKMPAEAWNTGDGELVIDLYWGVERDEFRVILTPHSDQQSATADEFAWHEARFKGDEQALRGTLQYRSEYRIRDWQAHRITEQDEFMLQFGVKYWRKRPEDDDDRKFREAGIETWGEYSATARWIPDETAKPESGEWPQWR
jgi:hypothetical protein